MRSEKRKRWIAYICLWMLPVLFLATLIRVQCVRLSPNLPQAAIRRMGKGVGSVTDRSGAVLYDGHAVKNPEIMGNLIGNNDRFIENGIVYRYGAKTIPGKIGLVNGINEINGLDFREIRTSLLDESAQRAIAQAFGGKMGCCFSYNYKTGETYTMISLPSLDRNPGDLTEADDKKMYLVNRCLSTKYMPGSTMKIVTSICALEQSEAFLEDTFDCSGKTALPEVENGGYLFHCAGGDAHGRVNFVDALGKSCNGYFARMIVRLDPKKACETLENLGFTVNGKASKQAVTNLGVLKKINSSVSFQGSCQSDDVWRLIGENSTVVNVIDMAMIAGAVANGGKCALPFVVKSLYDPNTGEEIHPETGKKLGTGSLTKEKTLFSERTANILEKHWNAAVETYYRSGSRKCEKGITLAKTGTAEKGQGVVDALLIGVNERKSTAFVIVVEDYRTGDPRPVNIANLLSGYLPS